MARTESRYLGVVERRGEKDLIVVAVGIHLEKKNKQLEFYFLDAQEAAHSTN